MPCRTPKRGKSLLPRDARAEILLSSGGFQTHREPVLAFVSQAHQTSLAAAISGQKAIFNAIFGGAGHEFVGLLSVKFTISARSLPGSMPER